MIKAIFKFFNYLRKYKAIISLKKISIIKVESIRKILRIRPQTLLKYPCFYLKFWFIKLMRDCGATLKERARDALKTIFFCYIVKHKRGTRETSFLRSS